MLNFTLFVMLKFRLVMAYLPSLWRLTVHTALGEPGSSETAISATSKPCLRALSEDLGPLPQAK